MPSPSWSCKEPPKKSHSSKKRSTSFSPWRAAACRSSSPPSAKQSPWRESKQTPDRMKPPKTGTNRRGRVLCPPPTSSVVRQSSRTRNLPDFQGDLDEGFLQKAGCFRGSGSDAEVLVERRIDRAVDEDVAGGQVLLNLLGVAAFDAGKHEVGP